MSVHVHIDRLIIDPALLGGQSPRKAQHAIEQALRAQLATPGAATRLSGLGHLEAMPSHALSDGPAPLGARVGFALSQVLGTGVPRGGGHG
jgi:hypothetical protein